METAITSLSFKGSVIEAIAEAKRLKKLFVVYVSGDNHESNQLETSTWTDTNVADSTSKYCVLLHIPEGSADAAQFSAIYPQKPAPCITAIGYNGIQLWQKEGFVSAEILTSSLEKAWLSIHIQETTASFLTAALASKKSAELAPGSSSTSSFEQGTFLRTDVPSPSTKNTAQSSRSEPMVNSEIQEEIDCSKCAVEERNCQVSDEVSRVSDPNCKLESGKVQESASLTEVDTKSIDPVKNNCDDNSSSDFESGCPAHASDHQSQSNMNASQLNICDGKAETGEVEKAVHVDDPKRFLNDVFLNIRLPNSASLQKKFCITSTLQMVKDYVDENYNSSFGFYDLAIPYPHKVFKDQDLAKTLTELGLFNRQALVVVPRNQSPGDHKGVLLSRAQTNNGRDDVSSNSRYLEFVKSILYYINPFSYFGGGGASAVNSQPERNNSPNQSWSTERPHSSSTSTGRNTSTGRQQLTRRFGSNIHTLKHDEDDGQFGNRNAFWNGNSTQYGGGEDDHK